jgi:hypothetical protein
MSPLTFLTLEDNLLKSLPQNNRLLLIKRQVCLCSIQITMSLQYTLLCMYLYLGTQLMVINEQCYYSPTVISIKHEEVKLLPKLLYEDKTQNRVENRGNSYRGIKAYGRGFIMRYTTKANFVALSLQTNYTDWAAAACRRC